MIFVHSEEQPIFKAVAFPFLIPVLLLLATNINQNCSRQSSVHRNSEFLFCETTLSREIF